MVHLIDALKSIPTPAGIHCSDGDLEPGRRSMKASDVMSRDLYYVAPATPVASVATAMIDYGISCLPVISRKRVVGIVTAEDLGLRGYERKASGATAVREVMTREVISCTTEDKLDRICEQMLLYRLCRLLVTDGAGAPVGMLTLADLASVLSVQALGALVKALKVGPVYEAAAASESMLDTELSSEERALLVLEHEAPAPRSVRLTTRTMVRRIAGGGR